jgi:hypothetical protein
MSKKLLLVSYPSLESVAGQLSMPDDIQDRYGEYIGQRPNTVIDKATRNVDEVFEVVQIAPEKMERVSSELGRVTIFGVTREGERARVDINPFEELDILGTILLGEESAD